MYYQSYEEYMRDVLGYPQNSRMPTYNGYYNMAYQNGNRDMEDVEIEKLYPEIYKIAYPMVCKACNQYRGEITEEFVSKLTKEVYSNLELEDVRMEETQKNEVRNASTSKNNTYSSKTENNKIERETRQRRPNNTLQDLIRILILRELLNRRPGRPPIPPGRPPMPPPGRPPFPPGGNPPPRPPMPRDAGVFPYNTNQNGMNNYYDNLY